MLKNLVFKFSIRGSSTLELLSRDPPKVVHAPKTGASKQYSSNISCEEKHIYRI